MYEVFATDERDAFVPHCLGCLDCLAPDVDWPNMPAGGRLHGHEAVRAYGARQFAAGHPLVRLEGLRPGGAARPVVVTVRLGRPSSTCTGFGFEESGLVARMDVRAEA